jgi:trimeric autotransporter adhesin
MIKNLTKNRNTLRSRLRAARIVAPALALLTALVAAPASAAPVVITTPQPAMNGLSCVGTRNLGDMNCAAKEFTVGSTFSAAPGTPPFCIAGQSFDFQVDLSLSGSNADRYNIAFYTGENGNDPQLNNPAQLCSVATFPNAPAPFQNFDGDSCGDYVAAGDAVITLNRIKSLCQGDSTGALAIPYTLTYFQNQSTFCTGPQDVQVPPISKCQSGISTVSGSVSVFSGAYVDVTKQTTPDGDSQPFTFTATGPAGSKVIALSGATVLTPTTVVGGTYTPATIATASNTTTVTLRDNETARIYINALPADQVLTITEAATGNWETTAAISCAPVAGAPTLVTSGATRSISATLSQTNTAAACTVTNVKRPRITLQKQVGGRIASTDQFQVGATGGGTVTGTTSAVTSGTLTSAATTFYSSPGVAVTLNDTQVAGTTPAARYSGSLSCSNAFTGPGATPAASLPNRLITNSYTFAPAAGDLITCTYTNTPRPTLGKAYSLTTVATGSSSTLNFTITNGATNPAQSGLAFTDSFPAGLTVTGVSAVTGAGCSGTPSFTPSSVSLAAGAMSAGTASCSFSATVRGDTGGSYLNNSTRFSGQGGGLDTAAASATLNVYAPPTVSKVFATPDISAGGSSVLRLTLANPAVNPGAVSSVRVDDVFPAGMTLQNSTFSFSPAACGTATKTTGAASASGDSSIRFSTPSLAPGGSCQLSMNVTSATAGAASNTTNAPVATGPVSLTGSAATAVLTVGGLPLVSILKSADTSNANPGQAVLYTVQVVNSGNGAGAQVVLTDELSPYSAFHLGGGTPFTFVDSSPASGLSLGTPQYSNDRGVSWGYLPASSGGGAPAGSDGNVTNWRLPMIGNLRVGGSFLLRYRVIVK